MHPPPLVRFALGIGVAVPFLYYGTQLIAAKFYPGYSFLSQAASMLGSDLAPLPWIFNSGAFAVGFASFIAAYGFLRALLFLGSRPAWAWLVAFSLAVGAVAAIKAAAFPLPHRYHGSGPLTIGVLLLPTLLLAALWKRDDARAMRWYLAATNLLILAMIPVMSGMTGLDTTPYIGINQRIATLAIYPPIGVAAWYLLRRLRRPIR